MGYKTSSHTPLHNKNIWHVIKQHWKCVHIGTKSLITGDSYIISQQKAGIDVHKCWSNWIVGEARSQLAKHTTLGGLGTCLPTNLEPPLAILNPNNSSAVRLYTYYTLYYLRIIISWHNPEVAAVKRMQSGSSSWNRRNQVATTEVDAIGEQLGLAIRD